MNSLSQSPKSSLIGKIGCRVNLTQTSASDLIILILEINLAFLLFLLLHFGKAVSCVERGKKGSVCLNKVFRVRVL